ncbi:hypothetical protein V1523DRAFT_415422 [Lipomyces doorenjongii]
MAHHHAAAHGSLSSTTLDSQPIISTSVDMASQMSGAEESMHTAAESFTDVSDDEDEIEEVDQEEQEVITYSDYQCIADEVSLDETEDDFSPTTSALEKRRIRLRKARERRLFIELGKMITPSSSVTTSSSNKESSIILRVLEAQQEGRLRADLSRKKWGPVRAYFPPSDGSCLILKLSTEMLQKIIDHTFFEMMSKLNVVRGHGLDTFACVCRTFNMMVQPYAFDRVTLRSVADLYDLMFLDRASPHIRQWLDSFSGNFSISNSVEAKRVGAALGEILETCKNIQWISLVVSHNPGTIPYLPILGPKKRNLRNLRELAITVPVLHTPIIGFLMHFDNLRALNLRNTNLGEFRNVGKQARFRLPSLITLDLDSCILGYNSVQMFANALINVEEIWASGVPVGIMDLITAIMSRTNTLHTVQMRRCNGPPRAPRPTLKFWHRLRHIVLDECFMLHPDFFPSARGSHISALPNLRSLHVTANLRVPMSPFDFEELMEAIKQLPSLFSNSEIFDPETGTTKRICNVGALITCPLGTYKDMFGSGLVGSSSLRGSPNVLSQEYTLLETVGSKNDRRVEFIRDFELHKLTSEVMNEWTNFPDNVFI